MLTPTVIHLFLVVVAMLLAVVLIIALRRHRKAAQQRCAPGGATPLQENDGSLKLALWASGEVFWNYDLDNQLVHWMRADEHSAPGDTISMLSHTGPLPPVHPKDAALLNRRLCSHLRGDTPLLTSEHRVDVAGDGDWIWLRVCGRVIESDSKGRATRMAGTARDITASRNAEYEHRVAIEVMRSMSEAVAVLDPDLRFITVNQSFTRITGYENSEVSGQPLALLDSQQYPDDNATRICAELRRTGSWSGEAWKLRKDGQEILCRIETNLVPDTSKQRLIMVLILSDITEQKRAEHELRYLANYDALTNLANRSLLHERLSQALERARQESRLLAVLFIDLDRFKDINDSLGHATGDRVLRAAAERVQQTVGSQHTIARLSGDEFIVVLGGITSLLDAERMAKCIIQAFRQPLSFEGPLDLVVSVSIGISLYPDHALTPTDLLQHADTAMYQAKSDGRHTWSVYSQPMEEKTRDRAILSNALHRALERNELRVVYQPRLSLAHGHITGTEALLRWENSDLGEIPPSQFIPRAEESGLIVEIGTWTLRQACRTLKQWQVAGLKGLNVAVNVSSLQLQRGNLAKVIASVLDETGIDAACLELEITESVLMANPEHASRVLNDCRQLGVSIAIDDFGTGYSSLAYLKRLPLNTLKIDQEFIRDLNQDIEDEAITSAIIAMAHSLDLKVIAEGVENPTQLEFLRQRGCDEVQGHMVARALEADQCMAFIHNYLAEPVRSSKP